MRAPLLAVLALCAAVPAAAQKLDIGAIKAAAQGSASEFAELKTMLRDPDVNLRLATFDAMVGNGDPSLYEIAVSTAIVDSDEVVRSRALWEILSRLPTVQVLVDPEGTVTDDTRKMLQESYQGRMSFATVSAVPDKGCINLSSAQKGECNPNYNLTVNGTNVGFVYANQYLDGTLMLEGDGALRGTLRQTRSKIDFPVEIQLR